MKVQFLRRYRLGKGSTNGILQYMREYGENNASVVRNDTGNTDAPIVVRWGCTSHTGARITINPAESIHRVNTKDAFRKLLQDSGVSVPLSFFDKSSVLHHLQENPGTRYIGRASKHSQGRGAEVITNIPELSRSRSSYWSVIIPKQQEFRVYCFFGSVIAVAEKVCNDPSVLLWNRAQGNSIFKNVRWTAWPIDVIKEALKVHKLSGCDFEGVDVMVHDGRPYILESNSAPSLTTEYRKQCFAKAFHDVINHIRTHNEKPAHNECDMSKTKYKSFIHKSIITVVGE